MPSPLVSTSVNIYPLSSACAFITLIVCLFQYDLLLFSISSFPWFICVDDEDDEDDEVGTFNLLFDEDDEVGTCIIIIFCLIFFFA
jgi:hypothetical protein